MPAVFQSILAFLVVLGVLVFFHELGHYLAARLVGVHVEVFSIGFGPAIATWRDRVGTVWKLAWLPLGGYVKLHGHERPEVVVPDEPRGPGMIGRAIMRWRGQSPPPVVARPVRTEPVAEADTGRWIPGRVFHEKSVGARALVVAAGPIANFLLAMVLFACAVRDHRPPAHYAGGGRCAAGQRRRARRYPGGRQDPLDRGDTGGELRGHPAHHHRASGRDAAHHDPARRTDAGTAGADRLTRDQAGARWECWVSAAVRSSISGSPCPRH